MRTDCELVWAKGEGENASYENGLATGHRCCAPCPLDSVRHTHPYAQSVRPVRSSTSMVYFLDWNPAARSRIHKVVAPIIREHGHPLRTAIRPQDVEAAPVFL
jgi:hypothetical protein